MPTFKMVTDQLPAGDQAQAIAGLTEGIRRGDHYQTLLGVTGSGKSVVADTPVFLKQGHRVWLERIGSLVDRMMSRQRSWIGRDADTEVLDHTGAGEPIEALSFSPTSGSTSWKPVRQLLRHRSPETLWRVSTTCGRSATVTGDHNFFVLRKGRLRLLRTEELQPGDHVPGPRCIPEPSVPLSHLAVNEMLGKGDRVYVAMPRLPEVRAHYGSVLPSALPKGRIDGLLRGERVSLAAYRQAVTLDANMADAHFNLAYALAHDKRQLEEALAHFSRAIEINPTFAKAHFERGLIYDALGMPERAQSSYGLAVKLDPAFAAAAAKNATPGSTPR